MSAKPPCGDYGTANSAFGRAHVLHLNSLNRASPLLAIVRNYR